MSRASRSQAQENRQRIVATASRMFREKGTAVSIADLMKTTRLTHGGFYKHFTSKDDLVDEAIAHAFDDPGKPSARPATELQEHAEEHQAARRRLIEHYLSVQHRDDPGNACPVSALATDLGRDPAQAARSNHVYTTGIRNLAARLTTDHNDGMAQLCTLVGALLLARATQNNPISEELLQTAHAALTENGTSQSAPQQRMA
ncbi:TetR/AcrR family transcriptional regulator [Streptomyces sp. NPDC056683]|uniref:TetR/AcrR family transcriptional regulator n=1 Tax=Streptomyces sp. NPDC056683 TaxID=3345910 RepID=UPI0036835482